MINKVAIISFGLDHIKRGVEANALMLFDKLSGYSNNIFLIKGSGKEQTRHIIINSIKKTHILAKTLGYFRGDNGYWESIFFIPPLVYCIIKNKFTIIYTQERLHAKVLFKLKQIFKFNYTVIFCEAFDNKNPERLYFADRLQEINICNYKQLIQHPEAKNKTIVYLPHFYEKVETEIIDDQLINTIKTFKGNKKIILFVGDHDHHHKNFQYLLNEFSYLNSNNWLLLGCGNCSLKLQVVIKEKLGDKYLNIVVDHKLMPLVYNHSDLFILPSLDEGFGISIIEAFAHKLAVLIHDNEHFRSITKDCSQNTNMQIPNLLSRKIMEIDETFIKEKSDKNYLNYVTNYSWDKLSSTYRTLFNI